LLALRELMALNSMTISALLNIDDSSGKSAIFP